MIFVTDFYGLFLPVGFGEFNRLYFLLWKSGKKWINKLNNFSIGCDSCEKELTEESIIYFSIVLLILIMVKKKMFPKDKIFLCLRIIMFLHEKY